MKIIGLYLLFGALWMVFEELVAVLQKNERYYECLNSMNGLELLIIRVISVILWPIPMAIWISGFLLMNKKES